MGSIHIVVDNRAAEGFAAEHGFSLWIESGERAILFDTGNKNALSGNLQKLGLDINDLTDLVLSHGHYDHAGGVETVVGTRHDIQVYLHQAAMQPRYVRENGGCRSVRMPSGDEAITFLQNRLSCEVQRGYAGMSISF